MIQWDHVLRFGLPEMWVASIQDWRLSVEEVIPDVPVRNHPYRWAVTGPGVKQQGAEPSANGAKAAAEAVLPENVRDR